MNGSVNAAGPGADTAFVIGAGRSGTTLVYKCLCMHPEVAWISNYLARMPGIAALAALNRVTRGFPAATHAAWFDRGGNAFLTGRSPLLRLVPTPVEGERVFERCAIPLFPEPDWRITPEQTACLRRTFDAIRHLQGAKLFISKRTANNRRIPQLHQAFPAARFLHIVRDGRAVARSLLKVGWWNDHRVWWLGRQTPREWAAAGGVPLELAARNWVEEMREIEAGIRVVPSAQVLQVHYEALVHEPRATWDRISGFLGLSDHAAWLERLLGIRLYDGNAARAGSPPAEEELLLRFQEQVLQRYGYR